MVKVWRKIPTERCPTEKSFFIKLCIEKVVSVSIFVVEPDEDGPLLGDGDHEAPVGAELDPGDGPGLGSPDCAEASLFVLPDLE